jgi:hypothetical protein
MCRVCWIVVVVLVLVTAAVTYKFVIQGQVTGSADGRTAIQLEGNERDLVLSEMRVFLESVQQITSGLSKDDMTRVANAARQSGSNAQMAVPGSLVGKLPLAFKKLGFDTHARFDELALDAEQLGDRDHALTQLNAILMNCVACHAAYRFEVPAHGSR